MREAHTGGSLPTKTLKLKSNPLWLQLEKAHMWQWRPSAVKNKEIKLKKKKKTLETKKWVNKNTCIECGQSQMENFACKRQVNQRVFLLTCSWECKHGRFLSLFLSLHWLISWEYRNKNIFIRCPSMCQGLFKLFLRVIWFVHTIQGESSHLSCFLTKLVGVGINFSSKSPN